MKLDCTHPARPASTDRSSMRFCASSRNFRASASVSGRSPAFAGWAAAPAGIPSMRKSAAAAKMAGLRHPSREIFIPSPPKLVDTALPTGPVQEYSRTGTGLLAGERGGAALEPLGQRGPGAGEGDADVVVGAEGGPGHHGDRRFFEQKLREGDRVPEAGPVGAGHPREGVEGAVRRPELEARDAVQLFDEH